MLIPLVTPQDGGYRRNVKHLKIQIPSPHDWEVLCTLVSRYDHNGERGFSTRGRGIIICMGWGSWDEVCYRTKVI